MDIQIECKECQHLFDGHPLSIKHSCPRCLSENTKTTYSHEYWDQVQRWGEQLEEEAGL